MNKILQLFSILFVIVATFSCKQEDPIVVINNKLNFSGYKWTVKSSNYLTAPGRNYYSNNAKDVFVDSEGALHLKIVKRFDKWYSTEVITDTSLGYGTYTFYLKGDLTTLDPNIVLGFFTWNDTSFKSQVNSEVDIEFAKFGNSTLPGTLQYTVQPVEGGNYKERFNRPVGTFDYSNGSTHTFKWTSTKVDWASYEGYGTTGTPKYSWSFNSNNPARKKYYSAYDYSWAIIVPQDPGGTGVRINFWTLGDEFGQPQGPLDGIDKEMIITKFEFKPL